MKSPIKLENDFREFSKAEKVTLTVVLALVVLVVISWAADGFAFSENKKHRTQLSKSYIRLRSISEKNWATDTLAPLDSQVLRESVEMEEVVLAEPMTCRKGGRLPQKTDLIACQHP